MYTNSEHEAHPVSLLPLYAGLVARNSATAAEFEFSKYLYVPQSVSEARTTYRVSFEGFDHMFSTLVKSLASHEDIALHSRVYLSNGKVMHLPMIDMGCEQIESHLPKLKEAFGDFGIETLSVYRSGRSYHIYGHGLLKDEHELIRFIGRMLLLNLPRQERIIDERWVGHRLMAGYLTLRLTSNNPHYKLLPVLYGRF